MNYLKATAILGIIIGGAVIGHGLIYAASTTTDVCTGVNVGDVNASNPSANQIDYSLNVAGQGQTATAQLKAGQNCAGNDVSLVSYQAPSQDGQPLTEQTLFDSQTKTINTEVTTLSIKVPDCFYQVDLVHGQPLDLSTGQTYNGQKRLIAYDNNGRNVCLPTGVGGAGGNTPSSTTPTVSSTPTTLPTVGAGSLQLLLSGLAATVGYAVTRKRQLA